MIWYFQLNCHYCYVVIELKLLCTQCKTEKKKEMAHLEKQDKAEASAFLKNTLLRDPPKGQKLINELLDVIMEPTHLQLIRRGEDLGEWMKHLYGAGQTFEKFCASVRVFDKSQYCGCVWTANFVAYRCKTCATSPCMSICAACFENGNHEGHEYNIFRSEAGGACDCGDSSVMKESGFCSQHGVNRVVPTNIPPDLLTMPKLLMERSLLLVILNCRHLVKDSILESSFPSKIADPISDVIDVFIDVMKCGSLIREFVAYMLLDEEYYNSLNRSENRHYAGLLSDEMRQLHEKCHRWFPEALKRLPISPVPEEIRNKERFGRDGYKYKNLLQELMFWTVRFEFQEPLILFLLNMLPESKCKQAFARTFVRHYLYIAPSLSGALHVEHLSNRIVHISVQLFSNNELAYTLAKEEGLLEIFMISLSSMVTEKLVKSDTNELDLHQCVATAGRGLRNNCYWAIVSDLVNCLGHNNVAELFLNNDDVLKCWMRILLCFTGMNLTSREMDKHVEYDPQNILLSFYSEREACASPLWVIVDVLKDPSKLPYAKKVINSCLKTIQEFLDVLGINNDEATNIPFNLTSFHYPVHRYFALLVANAISRQGLGMKDLDITESTARRIMAHPLQVLCTSHEILANMWVRNGLNISTQSLAYKQSFFCTFFIDADLFMLQLCSANMSPDIFISTIFSRCRVTNCLTVEPNTRPLSPTSHGFDGQPGNDQLTKMLESAFFLVASTLSIKTQLGISDVEIVENELISLLCTQSWTYSGLTEHIPQVHDLHAGEKSRRFSEPLTQAIEELSVTVEGDAMTQTQYSLIEENWKRFDPIFTAHRAMYKKNVQQALSNYYKYLLKSHKLPPGVLEGDVWSPFQLIRITDERYTPLNRILKCRTLHTIIFMAIYKYVSGHSVVSEQTLSLAIHLLEAAIYASPQEDEEDDSSSSDATEAGATSWQNMLSMWFKSESVVKNMRQVIESVQVPSAEEVFHDAMETNEDLANAPDLSESAQSTEEQGGSFVIQESILTLLLKLYNKMARRPFIFPADFTPDLDPPNPVPPTGPTMITKVLLFAASKSKQNKKIIIDICGTVEPPKVEQGEAPDPNQEPERERRRKKAREMQQKLLEEFANKQKKFLENTEMEMGTSNDDGMSVDRPDQDNVDCVICGASAQAFITIEGNTEAERSTSARNQIVGLICFVQSSAALGFRTDTDEKRPMRPPKQDIKAPETCHSLHERTTENFKQLAEKKRYPVDFSLGNTLEWELCPHISTCGHYLHVGCHKNYMEWVQRDETGYLRFESGLGFQCPLCRQTSNIVIPCNVVQGRPVFTEEARKSFKTYIPDPSTPAEQHAFQRALVDMHNFLGGNTPVKTISVLQPVETDPSPDQGSPIDPPRRVTVDALTYDETLKICKSAAEEILSQNKSCLQKNATSKLDFRGILRGQLEYDLNKNGGKLILPEKQGNLPVVSRRIPVGPVFNLLCKVIRMTDKTTNNNFTIKLWDQLCGVLTKFSYSQCPLLLKDSISLLVEIFIALYPMSLSEYQIVVRLLYNLSFIQALVQISCKFTSEERRAWRSKCKEFSADPSIMGDRLDLLLAHVIDRLPSSLFGEDEDAPGQEESTGCYTSTVWTPQCVLSKVEELLLHFMRITALLKYHLFSDGSVTPTFPCARHTENEFVYLARFLGILDSALSSSGENQSICTQLLKWPTSPRFLVTQWCKEIEAVTSTDREIAFQLLTRYRAWRQPWIVDIPPDYTQLFTQFRDITCSTCQYKSREPAMCLLCGQFVCYKGMCQHARETYMEGDKSKSKMTPKGAAVHAKNCGNGTVAFLNIHATTIIIVRGPRSCVWGTLYLDQHGEEDRGWKRGRKLLLKKERLELLNYQWVNHMFDNSCRNWTMHRNNM